MAAASIPGKTEPYVPVHLKKAGVQPGDWMSVSKLTLRFFIRPCHPLKVRIVGLLLIQTYGYDTELAVIQYREKELPKDAPPVQAPLSPQGIANELRRIAFEELAASKVDPMEQIRAEVLEALPDATEREVQRIADRAYKRMYRLTRQQVRKALAELESDGVIERVRINVKSPQDLIGLSLKEAKRAHLVTSYGKLSADEKRRLQVPVIAVYLLACPLPAKTYDIADHVAETVEQVVNVDYLPPQPKQTKELKTHPSNGGTGLKPPSPLPAQMLLDFWPNMNPEVAEAAARLQKIQTRMVELKRRQEELEAEKDALFREVQRLAADELQGKLFIDSTAPRGGDSIPQPVFRVEAENPPAGKADSSAIPRSDLPNGNGNSTPTVDWDVVGEAAREFGPIWESFQPTLVKRCQAKRPDITPNEIRQLILAKGRAASRKDNPAAYFLRYIPDDCEGDAFVRQRERWKRNADKPGIFGSSAKPGDPERDRKFAAEVLMNPDADEEQRQWAQGVLAS